VVGEGMSILIFVLRKCLLDYLPKWFFHQGPTSGFRPIAALR
jgi:hypothetical protein